MQRGFPVILVPSTGPRPQEGVWQLWGMERGWPGWGGQRPPRLRSLPAGHTGTAPAVLPIVSIAAFSTING